MTPYKDREDFVEIMSALWSAIFENPEIRGSVEQESLIVKFRFTDLDCELFIDLKSDPARFYWDPGKDAPFDVEMIQDSGVSHKFWMQTLNVPLAIGTRKVVAKGSVQKALRLIPALKPAFAMYPQVLRDLGREELLRVDEKKKKKRKKGFSIFSRKGKWTCDPGLLPSFPIAFGEQVTKDVPTDSAPPVGDEDPDPDLLKIMVRIRFFEEHLSREFRAGNLPTEAIHLSIGQEAVAAGVCGNLRPSDYLNTTHRGHGHIIAKGADLDRMMAEIYGRADGLCGGLGGSMHVTERGRGVLGANGIVGAGYLLALGAGFSIIYGEESDAISVVMAGDGSVNQGMFHEAMNMIGLWDLPVLVVVENNLYGEFTHVDRHSAQPHVFKRAGAYNIESERLDGNDVRVVYRKIREIIEHMRRDRKPRLVELMTYRWHGHMEGDPEAYRTEDEKKGHMERDPLILLERGLIEEGRIDEEGIKGIRGEVRKEIEAAAAFAAGSPEPPESALLGSIYSPDDASLYSGNLAPPSGETMDLSVSGAINRALREEMERDGRVFLWGEDVTLGGYFNVTSGLVEEFGEKRIIDTPISENGILGGAVGAAMTGLRPVCEILFADFLTCCMDPILNQAAKIRFMTGGQVSVPITIRTPVGSGIGMAAQHSQSMEKFFFGIPGLIVVAPSDACTSLGLLKSAIRSNNPVLFFEHKLLYADSGRLPEKEYTLPMGKARIVRQGSDVTIVTYLLGVGVARQAAEMLESAGIDAEILDLATLYPMDNEALLQSVARTGRLVVLEEALFSGSVGSEVIARVALAGFNVLKRAPVKISSPDSPVPYAKNLETAMLPGPERVAEVVEGLFS